MGGALSVDDLRACAGDLAWAAEEIFKKGARAEAAACEEDQ
jgi:hypothetical protein